MIEYKRAGGFVLANLFNKVGIIFGCEFVVARANACLETANQDCRFSEWGY